MSRSKRIPRSWWSLFWDHEPSALRCDEDRDFLIGRVLAEGGWRATQELRARFGDAAIRDWLVARRARGLTPERIRFWELVLALPTHTASAWVRAARRGPWGRRTAA